VTGFTYTPERAQATAVRNAELLTTDSWANPEGSWPVITPRNEWVFNHGDRNAPPARCLAMSGGGVRSAAFNLGVLEALAELGHLDHIDVVSAVSGGELRSRLPLHAAVPRRPKAESPRSLSGRTHGAAGERLEHDPSLLESCPLRPDRRKSPHGTGELGAWSAAHGLLQVAQPFGDVNSTRRCAVENPNRRQLDRRLGRASLPVGATERRQRHP